MNSLIRLNKVTIIITVLLTFIVAVSAAYAIYNAYYQKQELVLEQAKNAFEKNLNFRKWVAMHGGVYVFPTEKTQPNPYLKNHPFRDLETTDGKKLTLMNPAYSLREMLENFKGRFNEYGHITSLQPVNPKNHPDKWEEAVLKRFENKEISEYYEIYNYKGEEHLRYMKVLNTEAECFACHETHGYELGDVRGGISITIPMTYYNEKSFQEVQEILLIHLFILFVLYGIIYFFYQRLKNSILEEQKLISQLALKDQMLFKQSKIASLGEMLNNIAHHWRQPLSIISTSASGLKLQREFNTITPDMIDKAMDEIIHTTKYLSQTIEDFTNLIDEHSSKITFNISEYLLNDVHILKANTKCQNIHFMIEIEPNIEVKNYKYAFTKAILYIFNYLQKLYENSLLEPKILLIQLTQTENEVHITIKENTNCIDDEAIKKLFEPSITSRYDYQTNNLSLFLASKLISENLNGSIKVKHGTLSYENKDYSGVCFEITLPLENKE